MKALVQIEAELTLAKGHESREDILATLKDFLEDALTRHQDEIAHGVPLILRGHRNRKFRLTMRWNSINSQTQLDYRRSKGYGLE